IALLASPQLQDSRVVRGSLEPAVPALVVVGSILVVFLIRFIVLVVVGDKVAQRKSVVRDNEIDACKRAASAAFVELTAARASGPKFVALPAVALPGAPDRIPMLPVPFRPTGRKVSDLVSAFSDVPRLGNQFEL